MGYLEHEPTAPVSTPIDVTESQKDLPIVALIATCVVVATFAGVAILVFLSKYARRQQIS